MFSTLRFRHVFMGLYSLLVIIFFVLTDPDLGLIEHLPFGASTLAMMLILSKSVLYITLMHLARRALADYIDLEGVYRTALDSPEGAGYVAIAISLTMIAISIVISAATTG